MKQQQAEQLFSEVHRLHHLGQSNSAIAAILGVRRATVIQWLAASQHQDRRGWKRGRPRVHSDNDVADRICAIKEDLLGHHFFFGSEHVQMHFHKLYPDEPIPSRWYIDELVRRAGLQGRKPKKRRPGGSVYLLYPTESMRHLGLIQQSGDFIGKKYLDGSSTPITVFSSCYYCPFKLYYIQRTETEKAFFAIAILARLWTKRPVPNVFRMDNGGPFRGTGHSPRRLGTFVVYLLNLGITPLFGSPSKPWTNGAVEGHNRVFSEKIWAKKRFHNVNEIDDEIDRFNSESVEFFLYRYQALEKRFRDRRLGQSGSTFSDQLQTRRNKKVAFVRFVGPAIDEPKDHITIMNERVFLPEQYSHQFVFALWDLQHQDLTIYSEYNGKTQRVLRIPFRIND